MPTAPENPEDAEDARQPRDQDPGSSGIPPPPGGATAVPSAANDAHTDRAVQPGSGSDESGVIAGFGRAGRPLNRQSPFFIGFVGAVGVLLALALWGALGQMGQVFTLLLVALFLTLALDPIVQFLTRRGLRRGLAVTLVFLGLLTVFVEVGFIVVPPVAQQGSQLATTAPSYFTDLLAQPWVQRLNTRYQLISKLQTEVQTRLSDGSFLTGVFGGVLGVGQALLSGVFAAFTVLVLTLYFLGALPNVKRAAYAVVPCPGGPRRRTLHSARYQAQAVYAASCTHDR